MHQQLLKSIQHKIKLSADETEAIKKYFIPKKLRKRQYLLNAGDECRQIAFVEKGFLRSFHVDGNGHEIIVQFAVEGWWIADLNSFFSGDNAVYNIDAIEDSELLLLSRDAMEELTETIPKMERYFRLLMQNNIVALQRRVISSISYSAEQRYLKLMDVCPDITLRAPQQYIASFLGITPETLSRIRKQVSSGKQT